MQDVKPKQVNLQNYTLFSEGIQIFKTRQLPFNMSNYKTLFWKSIQKFKTTNLYKSNNKTTAYSVRLSTFSRQNILLETSQTTKLHRILRGYPNSQDIKTCLKQDKIHLILWAKLLILHGYQIFETRNLPRFSKFSRQDNLH